MTSTVTHPSPYSEGILELNCLVLGEPRNRIFPVKIAGIESVGALKKAIKDEEKHTFQHIDADALVLWKVSFLVDESLEEKLGNVVHEQSLSPVEDLSAVFPDCPIRKNLHIVVNRPALKTAIDSLCLYYEVDFPAMNTQPSVVHDSAFPQQTQYVSLDDHTKRQFTYVSGATAKLVFFGKTDRDEDICIKFVRSYSKDAHLYCASKGCAPALRGFE